MTLFEFAAVFLTLATVVGFLNARLLKLPTGVAMLSVGGLGAAGLYVLQAVIAPFWGFNAVREVVAGLDFRDVVLGYLLAFLLFAGGMHVDLGELKRRVAAVAALATLGVLASILLVGFGVHAISGALGVATPLPWCFVFAALISPTDPVAVLDVVRAGGLSRRLSAVLQGEALFNDGVGIVAFTAALAFASGGAHPEALPVAGAILLQAGGGLVLGWAGGRLVIWLMRAIDDYVVETTASVALAMAAYALAHRLHLSGPVAAASAGVVVGGYGVREAMSDRTQAYVQAFWRLVDEILNACLFLLLGLQLFVIRYDPAQIGLWLAAAALVTVARLVVVAPLGVYFRTRHGERGPSLVLAWGGMRGAISVALALSIPRGGAHDAIVAMTLAVVTLSVLVQGLTFAPLARRLHAAGEDDDGAAAEAAQGAALERQERRLEAVIADEA